nr:NADH dehydrogenase subunit 4L [Aptinothrips stylifer]
MISLMIFFFFIMSMTFFLNFSSFLNSLLMLESFSLILLTSMFLIMYTFFSFKMILFYFVFISSESTMGLSILVKTVKFFGTNNFCSMNLNLY